MLQFHREVVRVNIRTELHFLDLVGMLMFARFLFLLGLFVAILAKIHQTTDGRRGVGRDFHQVHPLVSRQSDGFAQGQNPQLLLVRVDDAHLAGADFPVDTRKRRRRRKGTGRERATQEALTGWNMFMYASNDFHARA